MNAMNPDVTVNTYREFVTSENIMDLIKDYDFIIDGTDNFPAKFLINDACVMAKKAIFSHAGIIRFKGQLMTYVPGEYAIVVYSRIHHQRMQFRPASRLVSSAQWAVFIGSLQAMESHQVPDRCWRSLTGKLRLSLMLKMEFHTINRQRQII